MKKGKIFNYRGTQLQILLIQQDKPKEQEHDDINHKIIQYMEMIMREMRQKCDVTK